MQGPDSRSLKRLGEYAIHRVIGEGGMGIVYEATERLSERRVALKVLHSNLTKNAGARERFFGEMRILSTLEHANIVRSFSSAEIDRKLVMVLEYLEGRTLREEIELQGRLPLSLTLTVASAIASALGAAHGASPPVVHRDLKPENVMLAADGRIKVMDFGIAKVLGTDDTNTTQAVGTVKYMSPEQAGGGVISPQTDLYALGLLIFEMLTGRPPFESTSLLALLRHHCETPAPPLPDDVRREIPAALEELMRQLLEKDPRARPNGAVAALNALIAVSLGQPVAAVSSAEVAAAAPAPTPRAPSPPVTPSAPLSPSFAQTPLAPPTPSAHAPSAPLPPVLPPLGGGPSVAFTPPGAVGGVRGKAFSAGTDAPKDDTIGLILRLEKKSRWPYVVVAFVALAAAIAGGVFYVGGARTADRAQEAEPAEAAAAPARARRCPQGFCAPFNPARPNAVAAETILAAGDQVARTSDVRAKLVTAHFTNAVADGLIDTTRTFARVTLIYALPDASVLVQLTPNDGLVAMKSPNLANGEPFTPPNCSLKRAWEIAFGTSVRDEPKAGATLAFNATLGGPGWTLSSSKEDVVVDASKCDVRARHQR